MGVSGIRSPVDIAVSGLRAEAMRMNVISGNIANANTSRTPEGQPYRRREAVLAASTGKEGVGVRVERVAQDMVSQFRQVYQPGHPDANGDGWVLMPNVELPVEMMHLVTASRAYQANAAVLKRHQEISDATLELLR